MKIYWLFWLIYLHLLLLFSLSGNAFILFASVTQDCKSGVIEESDYKSGMTSKL